MWVALEILGFYLALGLAIGAVWMAWAAIKSPAYRREIKHALRDCWHHNVCWDVGEHGDLSEGR